MRSIPAPSLPLEIEQAELLPMDLCIPPSLTLHVALDHFFVGILTDRVHVEAARPEVPAPEDLLDLGTGIEDVFGGETLHDLGDA